MTKHIGRLVVLSLLTSGVARWASAGDHHHHDAPVPCCYVWTCKEVTEVVYDIKYKEEKKKIKKPVIREIVVKMPCKACQPVSQKVLRECMVPDYSFEVKPHEQCLTTKSVDECGVGVEKTEIAQQLITCMNKCMVPMQIPVLEWVPVEMETIRQVKYLVREWKEEEVTLRTPIKVPRTITRKVWEKAPFCPPAEKPAVECEKDKHECSADKCGANESSAAH